MTTQAGTGEGVQTQAGEDNKATEGQDKAPATISLEEFNKLKDEVQRAQETAAFSIRKKEKEVEERDRKLADLEARLKGVDVEEYQALKAEKEKKRAEKAKENPEEQQKLFEEREQKVRKELGDQLLAKDSEIEKLNAEIVNLRVYNKAMDDFGPHLHPSMQAIFREQFVKKYCQLKNGELVIVDDNGADRWSAQNPGQKLGLAEWREDLKRTHAPMFLATAVGGGKTATVEKEPVTSPSPGQHRSLPAHFDRMNKDERTQFFRENPEALNAYTRGARPPI